MTLDLKRHGTTTLFAGFDVKSGMVHRLMPAAPPGAKEFLRFFAPHLTVASSSRAICILVARQLRTHKTPEVKAWLEKPSALPSCISPNRRVVLEPVERFFARSRHAYRRGGYTSVDDLETTIYRLPAKHNAKQSPSPGPTAETSSLGNDAPGQNR